MHKWRKELQSGVYLEQLLPRGFILPEDQEPNIEGLDFYLDAFRDLSSCRPSGLDLQAIPFTAIVEYFRIYELDDFDEFAYLVRRMDTRYLDMVRVANDKDKRGKNVSGRNAKYKDQR